MNIDDVKAQGIRKFVVFMRHNGLLSMNVYDVDVDPDDPVYYLTISEASQKRLADLDTDGDEAVFPLATLADITSMDEGGERPPGY